MLGRTKRGRSDKKRKGRKMRGDRPPYLKNKLKKDYILSK
jgi:hypothetical protein